MNARLLCWLCLLALSATSPMAFATSSIFTVTTTGSGGSCTANSTSDANCTLDAAIYTASNGDIVHFSAAVQGQTIHGTYPNAQYLNTPPSVTIDASPNGVVLDGTGTGPIFALDSGTLVLSHLTLQNTAGNAIFNIGANLTVDSCTFTGNSATSGGDQDGGAINAVGGTVTVINSTIFGNHANGYGGAIKSNGNVVVSNSTITGNSAAYGGGIGGYGFTLSSSIVSGNTATIFGPDIYGYGGPVSLGYNLIGDATSSGLTAAAGDQFGTGANPINPLFATAGLASNGGATQTFGLQSASPARSAGNCAGNASSPTIPAVTLDQRDIVRSTPCTTGAFDMTAIFYSGFEG